MRRIGKELHCIMHCDPGHGWLGVKIEFVKLADVEISPFSYCRGKTAYLEEDSDAPAFIKAIQEKGYSVFVDFRHTDRRSPIRSYTSFCQSGKKPWLPELIQTMQEAGRLIVCHVGDTTR